MTVAAFRYVRSAVLAEPYGHPRVCAAVAEVADRALVIKFAFGERPGHGIPQGGVEGPLSWVTIACTLRVRLEVDVLHRLKQPRALALGPVNSLSPPRVVASVTAIYAILGVALLAIGRHDYPDLHTILDTGVALLSGILALLLWDTGEHSESELAKRLALAFAATCLLELIHVLVTVEWFGSLSPIAAAKTVLRPSTWPPAAHLLPLAAIAALFWRARGGLSLAAFALLTIALGATLFVAYQHLPTYLAPGLLGITRPALIVAPALWALVGIVAWRGRERDRLLRPLVWAATVLISANVVMLYSRAPADDFAMVAHLGRITGYLVLLLSVMQMASQDMRERIRAEAELSRLNSELDQRVTKRTAELASANDSLTQEMGVRRQAEEKARAQVERLNLLHQITRAIGDRQDLHSIFQVVVRSVEQQLLVDFACLCTFDDVDRVLIVDAVGANSEALAMALAMPERARVDIDENGLSRCVRGNLVYEPQIAGLDFPFPKRLAGGGLRSMVAAPLQVESKVFGVLVVARLQPDGFVSGECEFLRQLSEHVALAAHQAQLYGALQTAYDDLRQSQQAVMQQERLRALGQMASGIAHDINNALSPVALYTESMLETETSLSPEARGQLEVIQRAVDDVGHTISRMREFYRQREPQLTSAPVQVNELVKQVLDLTKARWSDMAIQRGTVVTVQTELAKDLPAVTGVESEIREALINLVFNAVDALPNGGVLTVRSMASDVAGSGSVRIEICDDGVGMDAETRRRCLEPFFTTKGERGTGLGLAMVYGVAQRHAAEIDISSTPGEGTTVALIFAARAPGAEAAGSDSETYAYPPRMCLLLVDDDPVLLKALSDALTNDGHVVVTANDGQAGIDTFATSLVESVRFDAVITDLGMPYVDGRLVAAAIKGLSPSTPVLLLTGWGQGLLAENDVPPHVDQVLGKPPKMREIRAALVRHAAGVQP